MTFTLRKPPSINHIYGFTSKGGFARSYITKVGKAWFAVAEKKIHDENPDPMITAPVSLKIALYTARVQDIDNILKPILDVLQKAQVIKNDNQIYSLHVEKIRSKISDERVEVTLTNLS
jgi:Holliday junction resolvase RusA-like endonuclease